MVRTIPDPTPVDGDPRGAAREIPFEATVTHQVADARTTPGRFLRRPAGAGVEPGAAEPPGSGCGAPSRPGGGVRGSGHESGGSRWRRARPTTRSARMMTATPRIRRHGGEVGYLGMVFMRGAPQRRVGGCRLPSAPTRRLRTPRRVARQAPVPDLRAIGDQEAWLCIVGAAVLSAVLAAGGTAALVAGPLAPAASTPSATNGAPGAVTAAAGSTPRRRSAPRTSPTSSPRSATRS